MAKSSSIGQDTSIEAYRKKRDFAVTSEPAAHSAATQASRMFVVQKHAAHRAGLHWDFRLEHGGVLWSWAVPKGPSLDPADKRLAIHVEDHPVEYADFVGAIPAGQYGGGDVETWDRGIWEPMGDPEEGMRKGELKFLLTGRRLNGRFTLARIHRRDPRKQEAWFLIKGRDKDARTGATAPSLEQTLIEQTPIATPRLRKKSMTAERPPVPGAVRGRPPSNQAPQLCKLVEEPPAGDDWVGEIKFDGYRLLVWINEGKIRLVTRNGHDWTARLPAVTAAFAKLNIGSAVLDGELVALRPDGVSSFSDLQTALSSGQDGKLFFYAFDLLELDGWDLRPCRLIERKAVLKSLSTGTGDNWTGILRFSSHLIGDAPRMRRNACEMTLEGIVCKKADAPYRGGRGNGWVKLKCAGRDEFIVLGWTPPAGRRVGIGALHLGYFDPKGRLHYAGGLGTGFSDKELALLRDRLRDLRAPPPDRLLIAGGPIDRSIQWVLKELVVEVQYTAWSGGGQIRHGVYLGLREDKAPEDVVREVADPAAERDIFMVGKGSNGTAKSSRPLSGREAATPRPEPGPEPGQASVALATRGTPARIVVANAPGRATVVVGNVELSHSDRQLWPGITKLNLAEYWQDVAEHALPGLALRPLSIVRCPEGIEKPHFFQKNGHGYLPPQIREGSVAGSPYLAIGGVDGLIAMAQLSAIELHPWGASEADPLHPDRLVFDLDPGEGVGFDTVTQAAHEVRDRLQRLKLTSFCRTSGGKGLHVVAPLAPVADWDEARRFSRAFAELMSQDDPTRYVAHVKIADRRGRILIDWLRNGMSATAIASFCPRARPGAPVATPLAWDEVQAGLDPAAFTLSTVPKRLQRLKIDPWKGFAELDQRLPDARLAGQPPTPPERMGKPDLKKSSIVVASRPKRRR